MIAAAPPGYGRERDPFAAAERYIVLYPLPVSSAGLLATYYDTMYGSDHTYPRFPTNSNGRVNPYFTYAMELAYDKRPVLTGLLSLRQGSTLPSFGRINLHVEGS